MKAAETPQATGSGLPFAILRHDLPDASFHFDWLFAKENPPATKLQTFRTSQYPETVSVGTTLPLERISDHRLRYLTYQGDLSRERGTVQRLASGHYQFRTESARPSGWSEQGGRNQQICICLNFTEQQKNTLRQLWDFDLTNKSATLLEIEAG